MATFDYASKIAALLAKAESTDSVHEAKALSEAAERLMIKQNISEAEVRAASGAKDAPQPVRTEKIVFTGIYGEAMIQLGAAVVRGLGSLGVYKSKIGSQHTLFVVGRGAQIERAVTLISSLQAQSTSAMTSWWKIESKTYGDLTPMQSFKARRQFLYSFGQEVGPRLSRMRTEETVAATTGTALVLVQDDQDVKNHMANLGLRRSSSRTQGSFLGGAAGREAGSRASLGGSPIGRGGGPALGR